jgi:hypothetical protein
VIIRDDQHRTWVPRPPLRTHLHKDTVVAMNELEREVRCPSRQIPTEGTAVIRRLVVVHEAIFVAGESLRGCWRLSCDARTNGDSSSNRWSSLLDVSTTPIVGECRIGNVISGHPAWVAMQRAASGWS